MNFKVRKLEKEDIEQIIALRIELRQYASKHEDFVLDEKRLEMETREYLISNINENVFMFGGFLNDELVSMCGFNLLRGFPDGKNPNGNVAYICSVFTKEPYRRKGHQKEIMKMCMEEAKELKIHKFSLSTVNPEAVEMYKKLGFKFDPDAMKLKITDQFLQ